MSENVQAQEARESRTPETTNRCHICGADDWDYGTLTVGTGMFQTVEQKGEGVSDYVASAPIMTEWHVAACRKCGAIRRI